MNPLDVGPVSTIRHYHGLQSLEFNKIAGSYMCLFLREKSIKDLFVSFDLEMGVAHVRP